MAKNKKIWNPPTAPNPAQEKAPQVVEIPPVSSPVLSLEQVALAAGQKSSPVFKPHHLPSLLTFCKSSGFPTSGTESEMKEVMRRFGYKI